MIAKPLLVGSSNAAVGMGIAWDILASGGTALDAVEAGVRAVEDDPDDHTVGFAGYPNLLGQVELDASVMEGTTRRAGAVGGLQGYRAAVTVARAVMERLPHVVVCGQGAARLAEEIGLHPEDLLTEEAETTWREGLSRIGPTATSLIDQVEDVIGDTFDPPQRSKQVEPPVPPGGTVNLIAIDGSGRLASAVSTSGWGWKYPGRLGDTPIIGAGNYCDDRYGAAACTGWGELTIRAGTSRAVIAGLAAGMRLEDACRAALRDLADLEADEPGTHGYVNLVAVDREGRHCALTTRPGTTYIWRSTETDAARLDLREVVEVSPSRP